MYNSNDVGVQHVVAHSGHKGDKINKSFCYLNERGALVEVSAAVLTGWTDPKEDVHQYDIRACMTKDNEELIGQLVVMLYSPACPDIVPDGRLWELGLTCFASLLMHYPKVAKFNSKHMMVLRLKEVAMLCKVEMSVLRGYGKLIEKRFFKQNELALIKCKQLQLNTYRKTESIELLVIAQQKVSSTV